MRCCHRSRSQVTTTHLSATCLLRQCATPATKRGSSLRAQSTATGRDNLHSTQRHHTTMQHRCSKRHRWDTNHFNNHLLPGTLMQQRNPQHRPLTAGPPHATTTAHCTKLGAHPSQPTYRPMRTPNTGATHRPQTLPQKAIPATLRHDQAPPAMPQATAANWEQTSQPTAATTPTPSGATRRLPAATLKHTTEPKHPHRQQQTYRHLQPKKTEKSSRPRSTYHTCPWRLQRGTTTLQPQANPRHDHGGTLPMGPNRTARPAGQGGYHSRGHTTGWQPRRRGGATRT